MKFEDAILFLRQGQAIYRSSDPEKGYLCGTPDKIWGSFYLTIADVLAEDWEVKDERK